MGASWGPSLGTFQRLCGGAAPALPLHPSRRLRRRTVATRAALPLDPAALAQVACAATASSLLTAAWFQRGASPQQQQQEAGAAAADAEREAAERQGRASEVPPSEADTVQQVWAAAWGAFEQPAQPAAGGEASNAAEHSPYEDEPVAAKPLLLLQGIRASARVRLLALSLAAVEEAVRRLPPGVALLRGAQWRAVCAALLANASMATSAAWLGYVPEELQEAVRLQRESLDPAALAAAGLGRPAGSPEAAGRDAGGAAAAGPSAGPGGAWLRHKRRQQQQVRGEESGGSAATASSTSSSGGGSGGGSVSRSTRIKNFYWVGLPERLALYCSVLRLLRSHSISQQAEQDQQQQREAGEEALQSHAGTDVQGSSAATGAAVFETLPEPPLGCLAAAAADGTRETSALAVRQGALHKLQDAAAPNMQLRGWRATSAGVKSSSQLLALAPSMLQDMAVMVAEAVAAGYLSDVDAGLDPAAALQSAAALRAAGGGSASDSMGNSRAAGSGDGSPGDGGGAFWEKAPGPSSPAAAGAEELVPVATAAGLEAGGLGATRGEGDGSAAGGLLPLEASYWPTYTHRQLSSTRQLQRFTNQVVLQRWLHRHYHAVAAMYEDRMDLFGLRPGAILQVRRVPLRRVAELNSLRGPRFLMSLLLELADLAAPALRALWRHASAFVSWLLVRLIGQSLGLVYKGIKMSLSPSQRQPAQPKRGRGSKKQQQQQQQERGPDAGDGGGLEGAALWGGLFT